MSRPGISVVDIFKSSWAELPGRKWAFGRLLLLSLFFYFATVGPIGYIAYIKHGKSLQAEALGVDYNIFSTDFLLLIVLFSVVLALASAMVEGLMVSTALSVANKKVTKKLATNAPVHQHSIIRKRDIFASKSWPFFIRIDIYGK